MQKLSRRSTGSLVLRRIAVPIAFFCGGCISSNLYYQFYEPEIINIIDVDCLQCPPLEITKYGSSITVRYQPTGNVLFVTTYDAKGHHGVLNQSSWTSGSVPSRKSQEVSFWIAMKCGDLEKWYFTPGVAILRDTQNKNVREIPLRRFREYRSDVFLPQGPWTVGPASKGIDEGAPIDRGEVLSCDNQHPRMVSAIFDFDPTLTHLEIALGGSIQNGDKAVAVPPIRLTLKASKEFYKVIPLFSPPI